MPSLNYEEIYSKFRLKAEAYDILAVSYTHLTLPTNSLV